VSNSGLIFQVHDPQGAHGFDDEIIELIVSVQPPIQAMDSLRFTVWPAASFSMKLSSRVFLTRAAISFKASSQKCLPIESRRGGALAA